MFPRSIALFILLVMSMHHAQAQYGGRGFGYSFRNYDNFSEGHKTRLKRYAIGFSMPSMSFNVTHHYEVEASPGIWPVNVTYETKVGGGTSYGEIDATFFPVYRMNDHQALCIELATCYEYFQPTMGPINYGGSVTDLKETGVCIIGSMPVGFIYKSGGEVSLNRKDKVLFSMGAGVAPTMAITKLLGAGGTFGIRRYVMAEFGIFAGIAWKLRATYFAGNYGLINSEDDDMSLISSFKLNGPQGTFNVKAVTTGDFNISLMLLPFSYNWE